MQQAHSTRASLSLQLAVQAIDFVEYSLPLDDYSSMPIACPTCVAWYAFVRTVCEHALIACLCAPTIHTAKMTCVSQSGLDWIASPGLCIALASEETCLQTESPPPT